VEYRNVGRTGLKVSSLGLGTMTWGRDTEQLDAADQLADFAQAGGTLIDTATSYGEGAAEALLGSLMGKKRVVNRDDLVICTKSGTSRRGGGWVVDASRGNLLNCLSASLSRLGTDHVDLWLVQSPDRQTPLDETLSALSLAVSSGRARYVGLSNHPAWLVATAAARLGHLPGLAASEDEYSLLARDVESETVPACRALGVGLLAWSPLGRGVLTGKYRHSIPADSRAASAHLAGFVQPYLTTRAAAIVGAVVAAADGLGLAPLDVALAWVRGRPGVSSAIVGARTAAQLRSALRQSDLVLPEAISQALSDVSLP